MRLLHFAPSEVLYGYAEQETTWDAGEIREFEENEAAVVPGQRPARSGGVVAWPKAPSRAPQPEPAVVSSIEHYNDAGSWIAGVLTTVALLFYIRHRDGVLDALSLLSTAGAAFAISTIAYLGVTRKAVGRWWAATVFWSAALFSTGI